jgi:hypothetical protein
MSASCHDNRTLVAAMIAFAALLNVREVSSAVFAPAKIN